VPAAGAFLRAAGVQKSERLLYVSPSATDGGDYLVAVQPAGVEGAAWRQLRRERDLAN
jgi:hypothetical protein